MEFRERFAELLGNERGASARLSDASGLSSGLISAWKRGEKRPTLDNLILLSDFFGVSLDYLSGRSDTLEGDTKKAPSPSISENGLELLKYFEQLPEREQLLLIGEARGLLLATEGEGKEVSSSRPASSSAKAV